MSDLLDFSLLMGVITLGAWLVAREAERQDQLRRDAQFRTKMRRRMSRLAQSQSGSDTGEQR